MSLAKHESRGAQPRQPKNPANRGLLLVHGLFYLVGGTWPVLNIRSFEALTGAKTDKWLVKTTGLLVAVIGGTLIGAAQREKAGAEIKLLAIASAASLAAVDFFYVARRRIPPVYLCDGISELLLVVAWAGKIRAGNMHRSNG